MSDVFPSVCLFVSMSVLLSIFWFPDSKSTMLLPIHLRFDKVGRTPPGLAISKLVPVGVSVCLYICLSIFWFPDSNCRHMEGVS